MLQQLSFQNLTLVNIKHSNQSLINPIYDVFMKKESIGCRIKRLRLDRGYSQAQLGKGVGVSDVTISKWESGLNQPRSRFITLIAKSLRVSEGELLHGPQPQQAQVNIEPGPDLRGKVPLISWIQAGSWLEMADAEPEATIYYAHTANVGPRAFALRVVGDSMTSYTGGKSIPEGAVVIVDPDLTAENGKVVVARLDDTNEATLKQYVLDGTRKQLKPFNPQHKVIDINGNCTIIGVVKQVIQDF